MALSKVNYVDNQTVITAQNLNNIQNEIIQNAELIKKAAPRNLLDNSDFTKPVNTNGKDSYSLGAWGGCCIDRWNVYAGGGTVNIVYGGLNLSGDIYQRIIIPASWHGKVFTYAVKIAGAVYVCSGRVEETGAWHMVANADTAYGRAWFEMEGDGSMFVIIQNTTGTATVEWAALYEGEYTAETLPEYHPKGYMVEALNCGALHVTTTATLDEGQWSNSAPFEQSIVIPGIIESDVPHITPVYSTTNTTAIAQKEAWACVSNAIAENGVIRFICFEDKPTTTIPIQIEVNR